MATVRRIFIAAILSSAEYASGEQASAQQILLSKLGGYRPRRKRAKGCCEVLGYDLNGAEDVLLTDAQRKEEMTFKGTDTNEPLFFSSYPLTSQRCLFIFSSLSSFSIDGSYCQKFTTYAGCKKIEDNGLNTKWTKSKKCPGISQRIPLPGAGAEMKNLACSPFRGERLTTSDGICTFTTNFGSTTRLHITPNNCLENVDGIGHCDSLTGNPTGIVDECVENFSFSYSSSVSDKIGSF
jgi:hypothetical protein